MKYRRRLIGLIVSMTTVSWLVAPVAIYLLLRTPFYPPALITLAVVLFLNLWGVRWLLRLSGLLLRQLQEQDSFKRANQELEQERKFISNLLDTAPCLIVLLDLEGRIVLFNRACEAITQYSGEEVKGQTLQDRFMLPEEAEAFNNLLERLKQGLSPQKHENHWRTKKGDSRLLAWSCTTMGNAEGEISYILAIGQDITQSQQAEAELRILNQELEKRVQERTNALLKINRQLRLEISERQRLETVLRREIDLLARVMETSPVGILMANPAGIILIASEQAQEILKLKQKNYPWTIYSNPEWHITDEQGQMMDNEKLPFTQVIRSHQSVYNHRHIVKLADGQEVLLSVNAAPLQRANKTLEGVVLALEDITERVQTEQALLHSEAQFRAIFEQAAVGIGIVALSGKFLRVNQCYCDLLGYTEGELLGKTCQEITHPDDLDANPPGLVQGVKQAMRTFSGEKRYLRADNSFIWVNLSSSIVRNPEGKPLYMIAIIEDISERHRALQALRESEERFRGIIETANEGVWIINAQHHTTFVNQRMAQMLGYSVTEMLGRSLLQFMDSPSQSLAKEEMELRPRGSSQQHDFRFRCKDGSYIWTMISTNPIFDQLGNYAGTLGMLTDITERKETEQALEQANHQLTAWVEELEQRNQDSLLLNRVNDFLQVCQASEEAYRLLPELLAPLFPDCSGAIFMVNSNNNLVEKVAAWGEEVHSKSLFTFDECWALRRGQLHLINHHQSNMLCSHICRSSDLKVGSGESDTTFMPGETDVVEFVCVPMIAQGKAMGIMYLQTQKLGIWGKGKQQLAQSVSEHLSLVLANIKLRENLQTQSIRDPLTNLYNRRYMEEALQREISVAKRKRHSVGIMMVDVDHFRKFNNIYGHELGNVALKAVGNFFETHIRAGDIACRYGGEEFLLILPEASLDNTRQRAEQMREGIKLMGLEHQNEALNSLTISMGISSFPDHGKSPEVLIKAADSALFQAKEAGRDCVRVYGLT